jgi:hypothetical protein
VRDITLSWLQQQLQQDPEQQHQYLTDGSSGGSSVLEWPITQLFAALGSLLLELPKEQAGGSSSQDSMLHAALRSACCKQQLNASGMQYCSAAYIAV